MKLTSIILISMVAGTAPFVAAQDDQNIPPARRHGHAADHGDKAPAAPPVAQNPRSPQRAGVLPRNAGMPAVPRTTFNAPRRFDGGMENSVPRQLPSRYRTRVNPTAEQPDTLVGQTVPRRPSLLPTETTLPGAATTALPRSGISRDGRNRNGRSHDGNFRAPTSLTPGRGGGEQPSAETSTNGNFRGGDGASRGRNGNENSYTDAYRRYHHHHHDRDWWRSHCDRIVLVSGGYYYWDTGYWYPAWGYDVAYSNYAYDGPIYGYDGLPPDEVISSVQSALQEEGYYLGAVDGELGPLTRQAIAAWQRDHGLAITTVIDEPTMRSLGLR